MTYGTFLLLFLGFPLLVLGLWLRAHLRRAHLRAGALVCALAFVYTTPWDNYAAKQKLWTFDPAFVWGPPFWFGYLPLEEYLFYFAEAIFVCLVLVALSRVPALAPTDCPPSLPMGGRPASQDPAAVQAAEPREANSSPPIGGLGGRRGGAPAPAQADGNAS